ncbi:metal ABC transporter permease [Corynebacterium sp. LK19]|uniref:metal ABC transporter permease n=1 Tax=Corynebacterium TaxID=1716 RepID=UPI00066895A4|nr:MULTISPECIES: metal ABC transporter permease [unclassified Corynebacterium]MDU4703624.1 metal ABC transporter permease [Corynebacterium sp.]MBC6747734.1 metal ABC transporter permease [Corynebacterium sp. LK25]MBC6831794.1 metal ABC transporter permease [Corynebacterium sp. LK29]OFK32576.1 zinc ABC transporter permease [Corynebacterium sp. HMSC064E08]OFL70438.1 zinc ABC transporter permease [Corynebacterium sp. HMSC063G05]
MWTELANELGVAPFMFRPLVLLIALGAVSGLVGVIVNLRGLEFNAEAMVHSIFPGIVAGAVFGGIDMIIPVAAACAVVVAVALTLVSRSHMSEAGVAVVLTSFFSIGVILSLKKGDQSGQLEALMFGRLLEVTDSRLTSALIVCAIALVLIAVTWRRQVFVAFDRFGAKAAGVNVWGIDLTINAAIAAVVVSSASAVGVLLVVGYLVVPGAAARLLTRRVHVMVPIAIAVGCLSGIVGLALVPLGPVSPQAVVALTSVGLYFMALGLRVVLGGDRV